MEQESALKELQDRVTQGLAKAGRDREDIRNELLRALEAVKQQNRSCEQCPTSWLFFQGSCYYFSETQAVWDTAQSYCSAHGAYLVIVKGPEEQGFLSQHTRGRGYWLGLKAVRRLGKIQGYQWVDGVSLTFRSPITWFYLYPPTPPVRCGETSNNPCLLLFPHAPLDWETEKNLKQLGDIAIQNGLNEKRTASDSLEKLQEEVAKLWIEMLISKGAACSTCPKNWLHFQQKCYYFGKGPKQWIQARFACSDLEGRLVSIHSQEEQDFLMKHISKDSWIGLRDLNVEGQFIWMDGSPVGYSNWSPGEPNNAEQGEDCVLMRESGQWNDYSCRSFLYAWVCEQLATCEASAPLASVSPTGPTPSNEP
ncbi:Fc receptor IgE low affinity II alpha polypeptide [Cricetulus griseus]